MASVSPGYSFSSGQDPLTFSKLNLLGQPTVTLGSGEVHGSNVGSLETINGLLIAADYKLVGSSSTLAFSGAISLPTTNLKGNTRTIACTSNTACTITPDGGGTSGEWMYLIFSTDGTGGNVITYASPFKTTGTHTLTGTNKKFTASFVSDGTNFCEATRTAALS